MRGEGAVGGNDMEGKTSLWWDMESCPFPSYFDPYILVSMVPALLRNFNITTSMVNAGGGCSSLHSHHFSAYEFFSETETELHQTLINSEIGLQQLPPGNNNEMEKMMLADVLLWAMETPAPANIIFIVGNVDFCYVFQKLRQKSYNVFLVCQSMGKMPQAMLGGVNGCLGWLSFLRSLQNEDRLHFPGGTSASDHTFLNPAFPASSTSIHGKEMEELNNASGFNYSQENLFSHKPSIINPAFPTSSTSIHGKEMEELNNASGFNYSQENLFSLKPSIIGFDGWDSTGNLPPTHADGWDSTGNLLPSHRDGWDSTSNYPSTVSDGWDGPCNFPLDETARSPGQPEPCFHGPFNRTRKPRSPGSSSSSTSTEKKKPASLEEFKAWLTLVVNGKKHTEEGYNISPIRVDFEKATGKSLDEKFLGYPKIINLVEGCKDVAVIREVKRGCHLAFPVKLNKQKNPMPSPGGWNSNQHKKFQSKDKPRAGTNPKPKHKASAEDFRKFIYHMLQAGEFSQGFLMARLPKRFEQLTGKILDVDNLGYKRISELVASYSDLISVHCVGPGPVRIFPSGLVNEPVPNLYPNSNTVDVTSINMDRNPTNLKTKVKVDRPSSGGSGKGLIESVDWEENVSYGQSQWPPVTFGCFNPREANTPAFQEYSIKSDSSSPPAGSQVSEWEGQSSNAIGETMSFHGELEGSDFIKQHVSSPLWESNAPSPQWESNAPSPQWESNAPIESNVPSPQWESNDPIESNVPSPQWESNDPIESNAPSPQWESNAPSPQWESNAPIESNVPSPQWESNAPSPQWESNVPIESNAPIEDLVNAECPIVEAMQNLSITKENINFCEEPCVPAETGLPDSTPPSSESPESEPLTVGSNSPLASLPCRVESSDFLGEDLRHGIRLDCKQNAQNTSSAGNEEKIISGVSSAGSIIQVAGRGLKSICELKMWRKN